MVELWTHQQQAIEQILIAYRDGARRVCYQLPTGGGKSRILRKITDLYAEARRRVYVCAHRGSLIEQLSEELAEADIHHGIISPRHPHTRHRVQVCSIQTLIRRLDRMPEPALIIIDEYHHVRAKSYMSILEHWSNANVLGVTATPERLDGKGLADVTDVLITGPSMRDLITDGFLSPYKYYVPTLATADGLHKTAGDYNRKEAASKMDKVKIIGDVVRHYTELGQGKPAIACCVSIEHAEHVADALQQAGYKAQAVHSKLPAEQVSKYIKQLRSGDIDVLCQVDLLGEGVDIKGAEVLIMLRPTASLTIYLQQVGRVLRRADGKDKAIILDHVENYVRHGLPDDNRDWTLDGAKKRGGDASSLKRCPDCLQPVKRYVQTCPHCEHRFESQRKPRQLIEVVPGQLVDIEEAKEKKRWRKLFISTIARHATTLKEAQEIGVRVGASPQYTFYVWKNILKKD